jgi:formylmethanofuran dehydrogenase subunit A
MEAAVTPLGARHTHEELHDTPVIDKGFYVLVGNNVLLYRLLQEGRRTHRVPLALVKRANLEVEF